MSAAQRGYLRTAGYYGRFAGGSGSASREYKFLDTAFADTGVSVTGDIMNNGTFCVVPQGAGESERVGRKIVIKKVMFRGRVTLGSAQAGTVGDAVEATQIRVILYLDKQCNGAAATAAQILGPGTVSIDSFNELVNKGRFTILKDKIVDLNRLCMVHNGTNYDGGEVIRKVFFSKKCNIPIEYEGATGAITEIRSNNIGMMAVAWDASSSPVLLNGLVRIRYSDN